MKRDILDNPFEYERRHSCFYSDEPWPPRDGSGSGRELIGAAIGSAAGITVGVGVVALCGKGALLATTAIGTVLGTSAAAFVAPITPLVLFGIAAVLATAMYIKFRRLNRDAPSPRSIPGVHTGTFFLSNSAWVGSWHFLGAAPESMKGFVLNYLPLGCASFFTISGCALAGMELGRAIARGRIRLPRLTLE
jgi:hypothetical protein